MTDRSEFKRQFDILYLPLCMYALRMVGETTVAEDIVEDSFLKAWEHGMSGMSFVSFKAWMYRCVRNAAVDWIRKKKDIVGIDELGDVEDCDIDTSERDARIWQAVADLPDRCREIFLMSKRDGISNREIAEILNLSESTVKNQISKALDRLRDALKDGYKPFFLPFL